MILSYKESSDIFYDIFREDMYVIQNQIFQKFLIGHKKLTLDNYFYFILEKWNKIKKLYNKQFEKWKKNHYGFGILNENDFKECIKERFKERIYDASIKECLVFMYMKHKNINISIADKNENQDYKFDLFINIKGIDKKIGLQIKSCNSFGIPSKATSEKIPDEHKKQISYHKYKDIAHYIFIDYESDYNKESTLVYKGKYMQKNYIYKFFKREELFSILDEVLKLIIEEENIDTRILE